MTEAEDYIIDFTKEFAKKNFNTEVRVGFLRPHTSKLFGTFTKDIKTIKYSRSFIEANKDNKKALEYLAIHETCHLGSILHNAKFKRLCKKYGMPSYRVVKIKGVIVPEPTRYYLVKCPKCEKKFKELKFKSNFGVCLDCCVKHNGNKYSEEYRLTFIRYVDETKETK